VPLKDPSCSNDRGLYMYGGGELVTDYGHYLRVQDSSSAEAHKVWLFVDHFPDWYRGKVFASLAIDPKGDLPSAGIHLTVRQVVELMGRFYQFLATVDPEELAQAKREVYG